MSASDEEAFESADEGEAGSAQAKASPEKPKASGESSKPPPSGGGDKAKGKQKGKQQQQQQRKTKAKAQAKPAADKTEKPAAEKSSKGKKPETKGSQGESKQNTKDETNTAAGSPRPAASESAKPSAAKSLAKSESFSGNAQGSLAEKDSETQRDKTAPEKTADKEKSSETVPSAESSEPQGKSASEIRQSLSSNTEEDTRVENPADQSIARDSGDAVADSAEEEKEQKASGESSDSGGGWNWGWGSSLLNAATNSLETFSSQVGEGLTTIIDSVESSFGVPDPQELARGDSATELTSKSDDSETVTVQPHEKEGSEKPETEKKEETESKRKEAKEEEGKGEEASGGRVEEEEQGGKSEAGSSWLSGWGMSSISSMGKSFVNKSQNLMNTGFEKAESLAAGGLDILETIGKKTYTTLTEHDPGLRRAREFLHMGDKKPSLSSVLREAQERAEEEAKHNEEMEEARKSNFTALFEDNQGLAHLEALEMLSNQSERKVQSLLSAMEEETLETLRLQLLEIKDVFQKACNADDKEHTDETEHDFSKLVTENLSELHLGTGPDKLNKVQEDIRQWIADFYSHEDHSEISDPKEIQQRAVQSLADVTCKAVEQFHKAGELVLMHREEDSSCTHRAQSLAKLCSVLVTEVDILANKFSQCLNKIGEEKNSAEEVGPMVTNVYVEASNASGYIQDAFQLLLPVLQHAAIQSVL